MVNHNKEVRLQYIQEIQNMRQSKIITYLTGDRQGVTAQIGGDAVRPMYDHVRALGFTGVPRIDLFLYSQGGAVDVPWRMVTMLREYCDELNVLVPFHAHSAATLVALGADHIVMGKKGELGPIDPIRTRTEQQTAVQERMSVEDVMAFIAFLKERAGLGDQMALANVISILAEKLNPWTIGEVYRIYSHIRLIARKLLTAHKESLEERRIDTIIDTLAEKMYFHGHAIGRKEARDIGLPVEEPGEDLEKLMWSLLEAYEELLQLRRPFDPNSFIPEGQENHAAPAILACIESDHGIDVFRADLKFRKVRQTPPQLNLNLNLGLQLPPGIPPEQLPAEAQQIFQQMVSQLQNQIPALVQAELNKQSPIQRIEGGLINAYWQDATGENI